jgi:iron complex transport system substrate-binding protein
MLRKLLPIVLLLSMLLAACSPQAAPVEPTPLPPTALPVEPSATVVPEPTATVLPEPSATPSGVTVTDALGRQVVFAQLPQRVVIAGKAMSLIASTLYMFPEAAQRVVGIENRFQSATASGFFSLIDPAFGDKIALEKDAAAEQIAPLKPDVVIMKSYMQEKLGNPVELLGIPVVYVDLETPEQFSRDVMVLGQLLGNQARATQIVDYYTAISSKVTKAGAGLTDEQKPTVLMLQYSDKGGEVAFSVPPAGWLQTMLVELAGGKAVWKDAAEAGGWTIVTFDQIAAWNPDMIFLVDYSLGGTEKVKALKEDTTWKLLKAVTNGKLYAFAGDYVTWDQPDSRWILGLEWLATRIMPEQTADMNIVDQVKDFYATMYNLTPDVIESQVLPALSGDIP